MDEQLYPREKEPWWRRQPNPSRPWGVRYDLTYDGGGSSWTWYYRTRIGARISAWWNYHIASWGGSATLFDNRRWNGK